MRLPVRLANLFRVPFLLKTLASFLLLFSCLPASSQVTVVSDNFNDGNITASPAWSGNTGSFAVSTSSPLEGSHSLRSNTGNTPASINTQYGSSTNLAGANYTWTLIYRDNGSSNPTVRDNGAAIAASDNHWRFWIAATSSTTTGTMSGIYISHSGGNLKISRKKNKGTWDIATYPVSLNTTYSIRVARRADGFFNWYVDTGTAEATTERANFWITDVLASGNSSIYMVMDANNTTANRFEFDMMGLSTKSLTITQLTNGVHTGDLEQGMTDKALIGFAATAEGSVTIESVNINNTNANNTNVYPTVRLWTSVDNDFSTTGDNTEVTGISVARNSGYFLISNINHVLNNETRNYFFTVDVSTTGSLPASVQLSMNCTDCGAPFTNVVTTNAEKVNDFSFSGPTCNFLRVCTWWHTAPNLVDTWKDDWTNSNAWLNYQGPPTSNDVVAFTLGGNITPLNVQTLSFKRLKIANNTTVNISATSLTNGSRSWNITGSTGIDVEIEAGSALNITSTGNTLALSLANGTTATIAGTLTISGKNHTFTAANAGAITFQQGGSFTGGTGLTGNVFGSSTAGSVVFESGSTLEDQVGLDYFSANNVISLQPGSNYVHAASATAAITNKTFGNLVLNPGASLSIGANTYNVVNNLTGSGALSMTSGTINIDGDFSSTGSFSCGTGTVNLTGAAQSVRGGSYANLVAGGTGTKTALADMTVNTALTVNSGVTLDMSSAALGGSLSALTNNGTLRTANTGSTPLTPGKTWGGNVEYYATSGGQTIVPGTYNNLSLLAGSGTNTASGNLVINNAFVNNAGATLDLAANTLGGTLASITNDGIIKTASMNATPIATGKTWGGTVEYNAASGGQSISNGTYNNLVFSNSSGTNSASGNLVVNNELTVPSGSTLDLQSYTLSGTLATIANNGTVRTASTSASPIVSGKIWGGTVEYNSATGGQTVTDGTYNNLLFSNTSGTNTASGNLVVNGALTNPSNVTLHLQAFTLGGTLSAVTNNGTIQTASLSSTPLPAGKTWGGTIQFRAATGGQTVVEGDYNNLLFTNSSGTNTASGDITVNGSLTNPSNSILDLSGYTLTGSLSSISNNGTIRTASTAVAPIPAGKSWGGTIEYAASSGGQTVVGATYNNLLFSNASGTNNTSADITVNGALTNPAGVTLNLSNHTLSGTLATISNSGTIKTASFSATPLTGGKSWGGTIEYNATAGGQTVVNGTYNNLVFSNSSGTNSTAGNIVVNGTLVNPSGATLDLQSYTLTGSLSSINNNGTIQTASTSSTPLSSGKTWGGVVEYRYTNGGQTVADGTYNNIVFSNTSGTNTASGDVTVNGSFTQPAGATLDMQSYTLGGTLNTITNNGTIKTASAASAPIAAGKSWGGTIEYYAAAGGQTVVSGTYNNLVFSNSSGTNTASGNITVAGGLTNPSNSVFDLSTYTLGGSLSTISNNGTIRSSSTAPTPIPAGKTWGGTVEYAASAAGQTIASGTYNNLFFSNSSGTNTAGGNLVVNGSVTHPANGILDLGSYTLTGGLSSVNNTGTIRTSSLQPVPLEPGKSWGGTVEFYNGAGGQTVVAGTYNNVSFTTTAGTNTASGDIAVNGTLTVAAGGTLDLGSGKLSGTLATISNGGVIRTANVSTSPFPAGKTWNGTMVLTGTAKQYIVASTFSNLELDNNSGAELTGAVAVNGSLIFTNGKLTIDTNTLALAGTVNGMSPANSFKGCMQAKIQVTGTGNLGTVYFDQSVPDTSNCLQHLSISRTNLSGSITLGNKLRLCGSLTPDAGTFYTGGHLTLGSMSDATAKILSIDSTKFSLVGYVSVERYFTPKTSRRWIFIASPVAGVSFRNGWQDDIFITGPGTGGTLCGNGDTAYNSNGFDATIANSPSLYYYNQNVNARWVTIPNTDSTDIMKGKGYRVLVRGNRNDSAACAQQLASQTPPAPAATVIAATGNLTTGTVPVQVDGKTTGTYGYTLLGNPYACEINFNDFFESNATVINNKYWSYDPGSVSTNYLTYNNGVVAGNNVSGIVTNSNGHMIASGQAFFVESVNGGTVKFLETHKTGGIQQGVFKTNAINRIIRVTFKKSDGSFIDNMVVRFSDNPAVSIAENPYWDAATMNSGNFIASIKGNRSFAIQSRPLAFYNDTVWVRIVSNGTGNFKLDFSEFNDFSEAAQIILLDLYTGMQHDVRANPEYAFTITSNNSTQGGRFKLVFRSAGSVLPVSFIHIAAERKDNAVNLVWKLAFEQDVKHYEIQRSSDGQAFSTVAAVASKGNSSLPVEYGYPDQQPLAGLAYYRVRAVEKSGG
ncbi:MAG TPA: hypothetical protein VF145_02185, partial [Chitinophagaceae bacterium]